MKTQEREEEKVKKKSIYRGHSSKSDIEKWTWGGGTTILK